MLAIVASNDLAAGLADDPATRPDGFVVEGPSAGGHNARPGECTAAVDPGPADL
ncbi:MAG: hypothetical protein U0R78_15440 [Nocardioidaceae bacterium]